MNGLNRRPMLILQLLALMEATLLLRLGLLSLLLRRLPTRPLALIRLRPHLSRVLVPAALLLRHRLQAYPVVCPR